MKGLGHSRDRRTKSVQEVLLACKSCSFGKDQGKKNGKNDGNRDESPRHPHQVHQGGRKFYEDEFRKSLATHWVNTIRMCSYQLPIASN